MGLGKFFKALEKPFRTGRSAAARANQNAANQIGQLSAQAAAEAKKMYEQRQPFYDNVVRNQTNALSSLGSLLGNISTLRQMPDAPAVVSADPALIGQAMQAARMPFTNRLRSLRRRVGGRSGSGSGSLGSFLSGNALAADRAASRAAFDAQRALQDQALQQQRENEKLRYNFDISEQDRPFTQTRAIAQDLLSTGNVNPYFNSYLGALSGQMQGAQQVANMYAQNVRPGLGSQILAPVLGGMFG